MAADIKKERDRFVAFAFCWGDILLEVDHDFNIVFAGGAIHPVTGIPDKELFGRPITDIIADDDIDLFIQLIAFTENRNRIEAVSVRLKGPKGPTVPIELMGYRVQELNNNLFIAFRLGKQFGKGKNLSTDSRTGLLDGKSFVESASTRIKQAALTHNDVEMTMLDMDQLQELASQLGNEDGDHLMNSVGAYLRSSSIGGDTAARIDENKFSLVHTGDLDIEKLQTTISDMASKASGDDVKLDIKAATMRVDADNISDEDLANGIMFTMNQFKNTRGKDFNINDLSRNMSDLVDEAFSKINTFRQMISDNEFFIAFQPIIGTRDGKIHHYECLARFRGEYAGKSPYEYIIFAEETGLIPEFDLAMVKTALRWLGQQPKGKEYHIAVNVSGHSVGSPVYIRGLLEVLKDNAWAKGKLMFEITESARLTDLTEANRFIQNLRRMGYAVCLDDFGAGAASFQYLSTLEVDIVKLDGSAIRNARQAPKGRSFLIALSNLCRDLKTQTIAEMIDDPEGLKFVRECGINYVQGYLFGKPSPNITTFDPLPKAELFSKRIVNGS